MDKVGPTEELFVILSRTPECDMSKYCKGDGVAEGRKGAEVWMEMGTPLQTCIEVRKWHFCCTLA